MQPVNSIWLFAVCFAVIAAAGQAAAQDAPKRPKPIGARIALLESEVDDLNRIVKGFVGQDMPDQLRQRLDEALTRIETLSAEIQKIREETYARNEAMLEHDDRLDAIFEEVESLWEEVQLLKEIVRQNILQPNAGYDGGFFIASDQGDFQLVIGGFIKPYYRAGLQKEWEFDETGDASSEITIAESGFGISSTRLRISTLIFEKVRGLLSFDFGNLSGETVFPDKADIPEHNVYNRVEIDRYAVRILFAYAEYMPFTSLGIRVGQFKVPFDREALYLANELTFTSRSLMTRAYPVFSDGRRYDPDSSLAGTSSALGYDWIYETQRGSSFGWDRGAQLMGSFENGMFNYAGGIFNGGGPNAGNDNRDLLFVGRLWTDLLGEMPPYMSDLGTSDSPLVSIGAGIAYDLPQHRYERDPQRVYNSEDLNVTGDLLFKWMGLSAMAAVFYRHSDHGAVFGNEPLQTMALVGQVAYYHERTGLEPGVRYSIVDENVDLSDDHVHELTGVVNYYVFGQNLKLQLQYRGLLPQDKDRSFLAPYGSWCEDLHEIILMVQAGF